MQLNRQIITKQSEQIVLKATRANVSTQLTSKGAMKAIYIPAMPENWSVKDKSVRITLAKIGGTPARRRHKTIWKRQEHNPFLVCVLLCLPIAEAARLLLSVMAIKGNTLMVSSDGNKTTTMLTTSNIGDK